MSETVAVLVTLLVGVVVFLASAAAAAAWLAALYAVFSLLTGVSL